MSKFHLITGASSGIGAATARLLAGRGRNLILVARRRERLEALAAELREKHGIDARAVTLDMSIPAEIAAWAGANAELIDRTTVLVNNAGLAKGLDKLQDGKFADWEQMIDTNVKGLLAITRACLPSFVRRNEGHIVNLGSVAGWHAYPKGNVYCATKHAVRALTEGLRYDLNGTAIRVTEISPGMVETEFSEVRLGDPASARAVYAGLQPLTAHDIAETIVWSLDRPPHVNIQEIIVYPVAQASPFLVAKK